MSQGPNDQVSYVGDLLAGGPSNWGRWGADDEVGSLNYLDAAQVLRGAAAIRNGDTFTLQRLIGHPDGDPIWPGRAQAKRTMVRDESHYHGPGALTSRGGYHSADDSIEMSLQGSTQCDALGHVWFDGLLYNGYDASTTIGGLDRASVAPLGERGIVGRGVLLDIARWRGKPTLEPGEAVELADLLACAEAQDLQIERRDILLIRTNFLQRYYDLGPQRFYDGFIEPGLVYSPELVEWFASMEIPNLVTDSIANERTVHEPSGVALVLHNALMRNLGVVFTELCDLENLASACASDGRYEFMYVAAPLKVARATGSPVNPVAIR